MPNNPNPPEDSWAFQPIGSPFPDNPVKALGQNNLYIALWYKHGKPIHSYAWNNGGVVECSFPYNKAELKGARDLGGQIQVLQYKGDHRSLGYWYNWIPYKDRFEKSDERQLVKCGPSMPIFWHNRKEGALLGYLDNNTEIAAFSHDKISETKQGLDLNEMLIIVRELKGGPPGCECADCPKVPAKPVVRVMLNEWADFREGDPFPPAKAVKALNRSLNTIANEVPDQYVALWYKDGEAVMGRVYNQGGKIAANFSWGGHEYKKNIGSLQILFEMPDHVRGFDYQWIPFPQAALFGEKEWFPVHVATVKSDISPAVIFEGDKEVLGKVDIRNERAAFGTGGSEKAITGSAVHKCMVLCRKAKPGCKLTD